MSQFVYDTFTDTDGVLPTSHTGETGATWTKHASGGGGAAVISNANRVRGTSSTRSLYYASGTPASADYDVTAVLYAVSTTDTYPGPCGRIDTAAETMYYVTWDHTRGLWELSKRVAGALTSLGTYADTFTVGTSKTCMLRMVGSTISVLIDGVSRISVTDTAISAAGKAGFRQGNAASTNSTGVHIDSISADDPASGGISIPVVMHHLKEMGIAA